MNTRLENYLGDRQSDALLIESLLSAGMAAVGTGNNDLLLTLVEHAHDTAKQLGVALDCTRIPKGDAA